LVKREQTAVGFDPENKRWLEKHTATTGESMSAFLNKVVMEYRDAHDQPMRDDSGSMISVAISARKKQEEVEHQTRLYLRENDYILYMAKQQRKTTKNDLLKIKDELFFSKYKVDTTAEVIKVILRDEIEKFDVETYEKKKGIKAVRK
jgi:hypothetical protein